MKNTTIILILCVLNCKAQSSIYSLDSLGWENTKNGYYKDVNNVMNGFEGTWLYTNGNTSLKIALVKSVKFYNGDYYEDLLIGGYKYIENGVEKVNTLSDADKPALGDSASIEGNSIHDKCKYLYVDDCVDSEKYMVIYIDDPNSDKHYGHLTLHKRTINGRAALKIKINMTYAGDDPKNGVFPPPSIPWTMNNIVLLKQ